MNNIIFINKYLLIILILFVSIFFVNLKQSIASINIRLDVEGCNNNNICEPSAGENNLNCSNDCTSCNNNGVCELLKGETFLSCPLDCKTTRDHKTTLIYTDVPVVVTGTILDLKIETGINYAVISWNTDVPTFGQVSWGRGDNFNDGVINNTKIMKHHEVVIENLSASTNYSYFINSSLPEYYIATKYGNFTTLPIPEIRIIPSIYNLISTSTDDEIILNWSNPESEDFYGVKIVRSPFFFPADPSEGKVVYDGRGTYFRDSDVSFDQRYYYSAFSYNKDLEFSSGVITDSIFKIKKTITVAESTKSLEEFKLSISDFIFLEGDLELPVSSSTVRIYPFNDIKIVIDANRLPPQTKTLILRIQDPLDVSKVFSYNLKLDLVGKFFYVVVPNYFNKNIFPFSIISYGLDNKEVFVLKGFFDIKNIEVPKSSSFDIILTISLSIIILIILFIFLFYKYNRERRIII